MNVPARATVRFTTDGTEPTLAHGEEYRSPWKLTRSTVVRVAAFLDGQALSAPSTHSYLFLESALHQPPNPTGYPNGSGAWQGEPSFYGMDPRVVTDPRYRSEMKAALQVLPSLSVVCPQEDLFGARQGLYVHSRHRGVEWEKACSLEWLEGNGSGGFQVDCGLRIQGNTGRRPDKTPKHSFRLLFKEQYGASKLRHRVFPDSAVGKFDTLVLRADYNNSWTHWSSEDNERAQRTRDAWLKDSHRAMGWVAAHNRYVWDGEIILQSVHADVVSRPPRSPFSLGRRLMMDPEYRLAFADRVQKHCFGSGALTPAASTDRWLRRAGELKVAILAESARWGSCRRTPPYTRDDDWFPEQRRLLQEYFPQRTRILLRQLQSAGLYPRVPAPTVITAPVPQGVGRWVTLTGEANPGSVVYYTTNGVDPRVPRQNLPAEGAQIFGHPFEVMAQAGVKARTLRGTNWSALVEETFSHPR